MCSGLEKDGWIRVGKNKSVEVWRLDPTPGEIQFITVRGETDIEVSPLFCLRLVGYIAYYLYIYTHRTHVWFHSIEDINILCRISGYYYC